MGSDLLTVLVFPLRQPQTLRRSDSWVLMFSAPAHAEKYQRTILRLRQLHSKMSPTPNATAISAASSLPPQGGQGEVKSHTHPLTMPFQRVSTEAKLFPFDYKLQRAIKVQRDLIRSDGVGKRLFPVRLCVANAGHLNLEYIQRFLKHDGVVRGRPWAVSDSDDAIMRVNADSTASPPSVSVVDNWRINFLVASDAAQFVRVWHRRPLPTLDDLTDGRNPIIKAECVF